MTADSNKAPGGAARRRRYDADFKRALVEQSLAPGSSVSQVAREHGINANQLFRWRRQLLLAGQSDSSFEAGAKSPASLVPVTVIAEQPTPSLPVTGAGQIEVRVAGAEVLIRGAVDAGTLHVVLSSLRR